MKPVKQQLDEALEAKSARAKRIDQYNAENSAAHKEIAKRNTLLAFLHEAQDIEWRMISLLNYLNVKPDDDRTNLLVAERNALETILRAIETLETTAVGVC